MRFLMNVNSLLFFFHRGRSRDLCPFPLPELLHRGGRDLHFMQADDSLSWSVLLFIAHCLWTIIACEILVCESHIPFFLLLYFCSPAYFCSWHQLLRLRCLKRNCLPLICLFWLWAISPKSNTQSFETIFFSPLLSQAFPPTACILCGKKSTPNWVRGADMLTLMI